MPRYQIYRGLKGHPVGEPGQVEFAAPRFACQRRIVLPDGSMPGGDFADRFEPVTRLYEVTRSLEKAVAQGHLEHVGEAFVAASMAEAHKRAAPLMPAEPAPVPAPVKAEDPAPAKAPAKAARAAGGE